MTTFREDHPCCCNHSQATDDSFPHADSTFAYTSDASTMEFGVVRLCEPSFPLPPGFILFVFVAFLIFVIRSVRTDPFVTFRTILAARNQRSVPAQAGPAFRQIRKIFSPVHLHALQSQIRCAYCRDLIGDPIKSQRCPDCRSLHHSECFDDGGCAIFGCTFSQRWNY